MSSKVVAVSDLSMRDELVAICRAIADRGLTDAAWAEIESADEFQSPNVGGGYDADEKGFCFSLYFQNDKELWVTLTLQQALAIADNKSVQLELRSPK